jgi:hypothetical protein
MPEYATLARLALDLSKNALPDKYDAKTAGEVLRQGILELNGGKPYIDPKAIRRNKVEFFELIEIIMPTVIREGLKGDEFFNQLVDERDLSLGDSNLFIADDNTQFVVSEVADGIAYPRRQRIGMKTTVSVPTAWQEIRVYEEWSRFMAGRISWNNILDAVPRAFKTRFYELAFAAFSALTATSAVYGPDYIVSGTYDEEELLKIVDHVEAATGKSAFIVGTRPALRKCETSDLIILSDEAKSAYYNSGYYGKLAGVPMIAVRNVHKPGTDTFIFHDDQIYIFVSDDKPIKYVREGDVWVSDRAEGNLADKTLDYSYQEKFGVGVVANGKLGKYTIT